MSKIKLLLDVVEDMRSLADSLQSLADAMTQGEAPEAEPVQKASPPPPKEPAVTLEQVRSVLAEKAMTGRPKPSGNCCRSTARPSCRRWILSTTRLC